MYPNYEVIFVSDKLIQIDDKRFRVIFTNKKNTSPAEKNDIGISEAYGEICAFINDDVVPKPDWLSKAIEHFNDLSISAVGGPGITPPESKLTEQASGQIYSSYLGGGPLRFRYIPTKLKFVEDFPSYNLLVRKNVLDDIEGFSSTFYGGEDTKLCLSIVNNGGKILYDPEVIVYHYRRDVFFPHLKQIWNVGVHRGYFMKKFPQTSKKLIFMIPLIEVTMVILLFPILFFNLIPFNYVITLILVTFFSFFISAISSKNVIVMLLVMIGIPLTHITYGIAIIRGLTIKELKR